MKIFRRGNMSQQPERNSAQKKRIHWEGYKSKVLSSLTLSQQTSEGVYLVASLVHVFKGNFKFASSNPQTQKDIMKRSESKSMHSNQVESSYLIIQLIS